MYICLYKYKIFLLLKLQEREKETDRQTEPPFGEAEILGLS